MSEQGPLAEQQLSQATKQQNLRRPLRWAIGIHIFILVVSIIGFPHWRQEPIDLTKAVSVDLVAPTGEFSAAPNVTKNKKPFVPNAKPKEQQKPSKAEPEKPPAPVQSDAAKKETVKKPDEEKLDKPKEPKKETKKADEKVKLDKNDKKKKSKDEGKKDKEEQKDFNSLLKNLVGDPDPTQTQPEGNPIDEILNEAAKTEGSAPVTSDVLALSEMDALKYQLARCWNVPSGAMNAEDLIVDIRVEVNPDRTVRTAEIVDTGRYSSDDFYRAAADSAKRALFHPLCTPLALPAEKYDVWKTMLIRFNPRDMFGG